MLFLFILIIFFHNNNGGFMKKIFFLFLFFFFIDVKAMGVVYISKKDIDTNEFVSDCDFLLYDSSGNIVDSWVQDDSIHVSNIPVGSYKLIERPFIIDSYSDGLSSSYDISVVDDDIFEFVLYNKKIPTPRNLSFRSNILYSVFFFIIGLFLIFISRKFNYI